MISILIFGYDDLGYSKIELLLNSNCVVYSLIHEIKSTLL